MERSPRGEGGSPPRPPERLLTMAEALTGRPWIQDRSWSQGSGHERWELRFPWQQHGLKLVQSLEGVRGLCSGWPVAGGRGAGRWPPRPRRKPHAKRENVRSPTGAFSDSGWTVAPDTWAASTSRSPVCPCLPATIVCEHRRSAPRCRLPRRPLPPEFSTLPAGQLTPHPPYLAKDEGLRKRNPCC